MAINENTAHDTEHSGYIAATGGGKSQCLGQNPEIPKKGVLDVIWDPNRDHKCIRFEGDRAGFAREIAKAVKDRAGRKRWAGAKIGFKSQWNQFNLEKFVEDFEWFCRVVWVALDGGYLTYIRLEELAGCSLHAGKAPPALGMLMLEGRKYGAVVHYTTQRPQQIAKTVFTQTEHFYVGRLKVTDLKKVSEETGIALDRMKALQKMQFIKTDGVSEGELIQLKYKNIK